MVNKKWLNRFLDAVVVLVVVVVAGLLIRSCTTHGFAVLG